MHDSVTGKFYDGEAGGSYDVEVSVTLSTLHIKDKNSAFNLDWQFRDIQVLERAEAPQPAKLGSKHTPEARLYIAAGEDWDRLKTHLPKSAFSIHMPASWESFIGYAGFSVAALILFFVGVPKMMEYTAYAIPQSWENKLGEYVSKSIVDGAVCEKEDSVAALNKIVTKLQAGTSREIEYTIQVIHDEDTLNALAAPGGHLILFSGVIDAAESPDEVAGVLAHEMAHVEQLHATKGIMRDVGVSAMLGLMFGDTSMGDIAYSLNSLNYSRDDESEADNVGLNLLHNAGIDPVAMALFFRRVQDEESELHDSQILQYFSTHPLTSTRIQTMENFKADGLRKTYHPALEWDDWMALIKICSEVEEE